MEESAVFLEVDQMKLKATKILKLCQYHFGLSSLCAEALVQVAGRRGKSCILFSI
jgi:hypothetical protein